MWKAKDLTGLRFGKLTAIEKSGTKTKQGSVIWRCLCECGNEAFISSGHLTDGHTSSCGCLSKKVYKRTHGCSEERLYKIWGGMKERCYRQKSSSYERYGGRGIKICDEWRENFAAFKEWALANGYDENAPRGECTIDRINGDGDYEPSNCRWVGAKEQANNRRPRKKGKENGKQGNEKH